jgi:ankyrin repeat protein
MPCDYNGATPLMKIYCGYYRGDGIDRVAIVSSLLKAKAAVKSRDLRGNSVLHYASQHAQLDDGNYVESVKLVLKACKLKVINGLNSKGNTALMCASLMDAQCMAQLLIDSNADVNAYDRTGWTPLMVACNFGFVSLASMLIDAGSNVNQCDAVMGRSAIYFAFTRQQDELVRLLIDAKSNLIMTDRTDTTVIMTACNFTLSTDCLTLLLSSLHQQLIDRAHEELEEDNVPSGCVGGCSVM